MVLTYKDGFDYIMEAYTWTVTLLRLNLNTKTCFGYATREFFIGYERELK